MADVIVAEAIKREPVPKRIGINGSSFEIGLPFARYLEGIDGNIGTLVAGVNQGVADLKTSFADLSSTTDENTAQIQLHYETFTNNFLALTARSEALEALTLSHDGLIAAKADLTEVTLLRTDLEGSIGQTSSNLTAAFQAADAVQQGEINNLSTVVDTKAGISQLAEAESNAAAATAALETTLTASIVAKSVNIVPPEYRRPYEGSVTNIAGYFSSDWPIAGTSITTPAWNDQRDAIKFSKSGSAGYYARVGLKNANATNGNMSLIPGRYSGRIHYRVDNCDNDLGWIIRKGNFGWVTYIPLTPTDGTHEVTGFFNIADTAINANDFINCLQGKILNGNEVISLWLYRMQLVKVADDATEHPDWLENDLDYSVIQNANVNRLSEALTTETESRALFEQSATTSIGALTNSVTAQGTAISDIEGKFNLTYSIVLDGNGTATSLRGFNDGQLIGWEIDGNLNVKNGTITQDGIAINSIAPMRFRSISDYYYDAVASGTGVWRTVGSVSIPVKAGRIVELDALLTPIFTGAVGADIRFSTAGWNGPSVRLRNHNTPTPMREAYTPSAAGTRYFDLQYKADTGNIVTLEDITFKITSHNTNTEI